MARGRLLPRTISEDLAINQLSIEAHLLYLSAYPHLDRDGLITGIPALLAARALPHRPQFTDIAGRLIIEWAQQGLIEQYSSPNGAVLFFRRFRVDNPDLRYEREARSVYPPPPGWHRGQYGLIPNEEERRRQLAEQLPSNSDFYYELLELARPKRGREKLTVSLSGVNPEFVRSQSGALPAEDQDQDHGGGGDQIIHTPSLVSGKGGVQGGGADGDALAALDVATLQAAAQGMGSLLGFHTDWHNYGQYVAAASPAQLRALLRWIKRLIDDPAASAGAASLPAVMIAHIRKGTPAFLTGKQESELIRDVIQFIQPDPWQKESEDQP